MHPLKKLEARITQTNSLLCIGLDSRLDRLPKRFLSESSPQFAFNRWVIDQTHEYALAYKPNLAFYEGTQGYHALELTMQYLHDEHPTLFTIADAKRADIGSTNEGYVHSIFDDLGFDAITLSPYLGGQALMPFLERDDKASIILCHTSNPGAEEFQGLLVDGSPLWQQVAQRVTTKWNQHNNCMLVVGATQPDVLGQVRNIVGEMPILVPGIGAQGGNLADVLRNGLTTDSAGLIINSSRGIIFADSPPLAAKTLRDQINAYR